MTRIEKVVVNKGDLKTLNNPFLVKTGYVLPQITALVNRQFKLVATLNPVSMGTIALYYETWDFFRNPSRELNKARVMVGYFTAAAVTRQMSSAPQPLYEPQEPRPIESISQDSREEPPQVISKSSEADNVIHDDSNADNINSSIRVSLIPAELVGKMVIGRCDSPPHELCPYLNRNGVHMRSKVVPVPKDSFGPLKTESPLSAKSLETILLYGRKEASNALLIPGEADYYAKVPIAQADLAVSPFKTHPILQTRKGDSTSKKVQSISMNKARGKENRKQRSLVPIACELSDSDSEDDLPVAVSPLKTKR